MFFFRKKKLYKVDLDRFLGRDVNRLIHEGEKSVVYEAQDRTLNRPVAIKTYKSEYDRAMRKLRARHELPTEGEVGRRLNPKSIKTRRNHPLIVTYADGTEYGRRNGHYFVVLELLDGFNLKNVIAQRFQSLEGKRVEIALAIADALQRVHAAGFVHRDVCADNVLLQARGCPKLIDLGFTVPVGKKLHPRTGTPSYISPEQVRGDEIQPASDIYSFGVVLYELFSGRLPFTSRITGDDPDSVKRRTDELMEKHLHANPPPLDRLATRLPKALSDLIMSCLEKDPAKRPQTVQQIADVLKQTGDMLEG